MSLLNAERDPSVVKFNNMPLGDWRVAWLGDVAFHKRSITFTQPTIEVVLENMQSVGQLMTVQVPVAQLWALRLGTVWRDKELSGTDGAGVERELEFQTTALTHCVAGVPLRDDDPSSYLLPFASHPYHRLHTKSPCLRLDQFGEQIVFPATEIIRFYFGSSGSLLKQVFSSSFDPKRLCLDASMNEDGLAKVVLAEGISYASAEDVARLLFDQTAAKAATSVSRSLVAGSVVTDGVRKSYPRAELPFSGKARLLVRGVSFHADDGQRRFLVRQIVTCSARFPWQKLHVVTAARAKRPALPLAGEALGGGSSTAGQQLSQARRAPGTMIDAREPAKRSAIRPLSLGAPVRFTDLLSKPTDRVAGEAASQVNLRSLPAAAFDSTGNGVGTSKGRRTEPVLADDSRAIERLKSPVPRWQGYFIFLRKLLEQEWVDGISFVPIHPFQPYLHYAELPAIVDEDGVVLDDTLGELSSGPSGAASRRLGSFANIVASGKPSAIISLSPSVAEPCTRILIWPGRLLESHRALRALYDGLCDSSSAVTPIQIPTTADLPDSCIVEAVAETEALLLGPRR